MNHKNWNLQVMSECAFIVVYQMSAIAIMYNNLHIIMLVITLALAFIIVLDILKGSERNNIQDLLMIIIVSLLDDYNNIAFIQIKTIIQMMTLYRIASNKQENYYTKKFVCFLFVATNQNVSIILNITQIQLYKALIIFNTIYFLMIVMFLLIRLEYSEGRIDNPLNLQVQSSPGQSIMKDNEQNQSAMRLNILSDLHEQLEQSNSSIRRKPSVLMTSQTFLSSIMASYPDGVLILKPNLQKVFINNTMQEMFKTDQDQFAIETLMDLVNCHEQASQHLQYDQMFKKVELKVAKFRNSLAVDLVPKSDKALADPYGIIEQEIQDVIYSEGSGSESGSNSDASDISDNEYLRNNIKNELGKKSSVREQYENILKVLDELIKLKGYSQRIEQFELHFQFQIQMTCLLDNNPQQRKLSRTKVQQIRMASSQTPARGSISKPRESISSNLAAKKQCYQITLKPFIHQLQGHVLIIVKDVTFLNKIEMLQQINENKSKMLAQVAHEFRNPLGCVLLFLEALQQHVDDNLTQKFINPIRSSINLLLSLVNDLLDVAQMKAGKFHLTYVEVDLFQLLEEIISIMTIQAARKNIILKIDYKRHVNRVIVSDPKRIRQIINNLISNSVKFTYEGCITVEYYFRDDLVCIFVQDTGVGIEEKNQSLLFSEFGKLDQTKDINPEGVGLGLMISNILAKRLAQNEFGETQNNNQGLRVKSVFGEGSCFSFEVFDACTSRMIKSNTKKTSVRFTGRKALRQASKDPSIPSKSSYAFNSIPSISDLDAGDKQIPQIQQYTNNYLTIKQCDCPQILIVDDCDFNILALEIIFKQNKKYRIDSANGGLQALQKIDNFKKTQNCLNCSNYKVILMDVEMGDLDGIQTTMTIRETYNHEQIIIIGCSGHADKDIRSQCHIAGMNYYMSKPIDVREMFKQLDIYF